MTTASEAAKTLDAESRKKLLARLARAEGQLRGVQRMITEEKPCEAVAQQLAAARAALNRAFFELIACSFQHKMAEHGAADPAIHDDLSELVTLLTRYA